MSQFDKRNLSMMMDLYEMTMANGYFAEHDGNEMVTFDVFYRKNPDGAGFAIFAGLEQILDYLENLHFDAEDIDYLRSLGIYDEKFLNHLADFRFRGNVWAIPEGTIKELQQKAMHEGKRIMSERPLGEIRSFVKQQLESEIWEAEQRFENPHTHFIDMSPSHYEMKMELLASDVKKH